MENGDALEFASARLRDEETIVRAAIDAPIRRESFVPPQVLANARCQEKYQLAGMRRGPLQFASERLRGQRDLVLRAVRQEGRLLRCASAGLQDDAEVVLGKAHAPMASAASSCGAMPTYLAGSRAVATAAVTENGDALAFASDAMLDNRKVLLAAVQTAGDVLQFASERIRADAQVVSLAVAQNGAALEDASDELAG